MGLRMIYLRQWNKAPCSPSSTEEDHEYTVLIAKHKRQLNVESKLPLILQQRSNTGMSRSMLPDKRVHLLPNATTKGWLSKEWDNSWNGITGPHQSDPSLRCQESAICEGLLSCPEGLLLRCQEHSLTLPI